MRAALCVVRRGDIQLTVWSGVNVHVARPLLVLITVRAVLVLNPIVSEIRYNSEAIDMVVRRSILIIRIGDFRGGNSQRLHIYVES